MNNILVKEVMIPVSEYIRVQGHKTLKEAMQLLLEKGNLKGGGHAHRDLLVEDDTGKIIGKLTMIDIINFMEPQYKTIRNSNAKQVLEPSFVQKVFKDFNLWSEPLTNLCEKVASAKILSVMHKPSKAEFINADATLSKALHSYVMGIHQPMLVTDKDNVLGVLRLGDIFEKVRQNILACEI